MSTRFGRGEVAAIVTVILGTAVVLMGIGLARGAAESSSPPPRALQPGGPVEPESVVGTWWVEGDPTLDGRMVAFLPSGELTVYGDQGCEFYGTWQLTESGLATVGIDSWVTSCKEDAGQAMRIADSVAAIRMVGDAMALTTSDADVVATLTAAPDSAAWPESAQRDEDLTEALAEPYVPPKGTFGLPEGMVPPTPEQLTSGRWVPAASGSNAPGWPDEPYAQFVSSGSWSGSDGCNGQGGSWSLDSQTGEWLASAGPQTLIGCNNVDVAGILTSARTVAIEEGQLVFYDAKGQENGRLAPAE